MRVHRYSGEYMRRLKEDALERLARLSLDSHMADDEDRRERALRQGFAKIEEFWKTFAELPRKTIDKKARWGRVQRDFVQHLFRSAVHFFFPKDVFAQYKKEICQRLGFTASDRRAMMAISAARRVGKTKGTTGFLAALMYVTPVKVVVYAVSATISQNFKKEVLRYLRAINPGIRFNRENEKLLEMLNGSRLETRPDNPKMSCFGEGGWEGEKVAPS